MACSAMEIESLERPDTPFSFVSAPEGTVAKRLTVSRGQLVRAIRQQLDEIVMRLCLCPSAEIFQQERTKVFGEYFVLLKAGSKVILADTDPMVHQALIQETLNHFESLARARGEGFLGAEVSGEILFSLSTLRRTYRLVAQILAKEPPQHLRAQDASNAKEFSACLSWCGLHLDCIMTILKQGEKMRVHLDVLQELLKGLRFSVEGYALARMGYDLRYPKRGPDLFEQTQWDDEDRYLAGSSTDAIAG